jgi:hypothetical protein
MFRLAMPKLVIAKSENRTLHAIVEPNPKEKLSDTQIPGALCCMLSFQTNRWELA